MGESVEGFTLEVAAEGLEGGGGLEKGDPVPRSMGARRFSARSKHVLALSPRLKAMEMKRGGSRRKKVEPAEGPGGKASFGDSRRKVKRGAPMGGNSPAPFCQGERFCFEQSFEEGVGVMRKSQSDMELMETIVEEGGLGKEDLRGAESVAVVVSEGMGLEVPGGSDEGRILGGVEGQKKEGNEGEGMEDGVVDDGLDSEDEGNVFVELPERGEFVIEECMDEERGQFENSLIDETGKVANIVSLLEKNLYSTENKVVREDNCNLLNSIEMDHALDLVEAQPLQSMDFVKEGVVLVNSGDSGQEGAGYGGSAWKELKGTKNQEKEMETTRLKEIFPPLNKETLKLHKASGPQKGIAIASSSGVKTGRGYQAVHSEGNVGSAGMIKKKSMAEMLKAGDYDPVTFEPDKIKQMGIVGETAGRPSIHFSGADTSFLAEKLGYVVVGKFSHSIPSAQHIQKALWGMKFLGQFTWSSINAKHVLIQFELLVDYAKLLSGPNGMPVWFIDRHPMRVFKWTPDFDPFFESPIAAIWCNLIGLPIHLFEKSALFAIGSLFGTPIQVDRATISRKRLSFARICVEIDISSPPPVEIVIGLQGREVKQRVKWDRIPRYCQECRHVGHSTDACYVNGKKEKPEKRDYNNPFQKRQQADYRRNEADGKIFENGIEDRNLGKEKEGKGDGEKNIDFVLVGGVGSVPVDRLESGEFQSVWSRRGRFGRGGSRGFGGRGRWGGRGRFGEQLGAVERAVGILNSSSPAQQFSKHMGSEAGGLVCGFEANPRYFKMLPNGDFDTEHYEDEKDYEMESEQEETCGESSKPPEKREALDEDLHKLNENGMTKKGRTEASGSAHIC